MQKNVWYCQRWRSATNQLLLGLLLLMTGMAAYGQGVLDKKVSGDFPAASLIQRLKDLGQRTGVTIAFDEKQLDGESLQAASFRGFSLKQVLQETLPSNRFTWKLAGGSVIITAMSRAEIAVRQPAAGRVAGKIVDEESGEPLADVTIRIGNKGTTTGIDGAFSLSLPKGRYEAEISSIGYGKKIVADIDVKENGLFEFNIALKRDKGQLAGVVVRSTAKKESVASLYARQKTAAAVSDGISAEQIARTPDNNAAQTLRRISGLQVSDEKYVVIRGLSERYNNVLLNGTTLPSSEPNRRNFAFDIVPTGMIDRIVVNKTATPDVTSEFTGGLVQIETKDIPTENFTAITIGTAYNTISTGKEMIGLDRGKNAVLGFASDIHNKPTGMSFGQYNALVKTVNRTSTPATNANRQLMHQFLSTMPENWAMRRYTAMPSQTYQLQLGRVYRFNKDRQLGIIASLNYRNDQLLEDRILHEPTFTDYKGISNQYQTRLGAALNIGYQFGKHKLKLQNTFNQRFADNLWKYAGIDYDNNDVYQDSYTNVTVINQLFQTQLGGEHLLTKTGIRFDWSVAAASSKRDQPYSKIMSRYRTEVTNAISPDDYLGYDLSDQRLKNGNLFYSGLQEEVYNWSANLQLPFQLLQKKQLFKIGYQGRKRDADFTADLYRMLAFGDGGSTRKYPTGISYEEVFTSANFGKDLYLYPVNGRGRQRDGAESSEGYEGRQDLQAGYAMLDLRLLKRLRLVGGIRAEKNDQHLYDFVWNAAEQKSERKLTRINQADWLPSINLVYSLTDKLNLRGAWYKTLARPDFREMSSFAYFDYELFSTFYGDSLRTTRIENADLRLEYYPSAGEVISVSGFYKKFDNPIEAMLLQTSGSTIVYQYKNLQSAKDLGFEIDIRKSLGFIAPGSKLLSRLFLSGNYTWVDATVSFRENDAIDGATGLPVTATRKRPLAGQSPYIVNGGVLYAGERLGINVTFNRYGKRIVFASPSVAEDEYELPRNMLDAQVSYRFLKGKNLEAKLNAGNLLNQELRVYRNSIDIDNPFGPLATRRSSVPMYFADGSPMPINEPRYMDPKGTTYNKDYDTVLRRTRFGVTFNASITYHF